MGLDISYFRQLTPVACDGRDDCGHVRIYPDSTPEFAARMVPLTPGCHTAAETGKGPDGLGGFRAGSYIGYNNWRDQLAKLAGFPAMTQAGYRLTPSHAVGAWNSDTPDGPFYELINFSDCEGTIGPDVSKKLAADFAAFDEQARAAFDEYGYQKYQEWRKAFEMAADGGAVVFH